MSFYDSFRWVALCGKLLGVFPVQNILSRNPFAIRYRVFSIDILYSIILHTTIMGIHYWWNGFQFSADNRFKQLIQVLILFMYVRTVACFVFCLFRQAPKSLRVLRLLEVFERHRETTLNLRTPTTLSKCLLLGIPGFINLLLSATYAFESGHLVCEIYSKSPRDQYWPALAFGFSCLWHIIPPLFYVYLSTKILFNFHDINRALIAKGYYATYCRGFEKFDDDSEYLGNLRVFHNLLSEATHALSICYGSFISVQKLFLIVAVVVNISAYIAAARDPHLLVLTSIDIFHFLMMTGISHSIKKRASYQSWRRCFWLLMEAFCYRDAKSRDYSKEYHCRRSVNPAKTKSNCGCCSSAYTRCTSTPPATSSWTRRKHSRFFPRLQLI